MSHSFTNLLYHLVWSTKERIPWLTAEVRPLLFAYLGGLVRDEGGIALLVNGVDDHVHLLVKLRQDKTVADVVRAVKANSSGWIHRTYPTQASFAWQTGYGAFSVSVSQLERVHEYIAKQEEHHRGRSYQDEYRTFLRAHHIDFTEEELWD
jgi:REP element-mobilizing transposase RayT